MKKLVFTLTTALILTGAIALFCNTSDAATYPHCRTSIHSNYTADNLYGGQRTSIILVTPGGISAPIDISDTASGEYLEHIKEIYDQYKTIQ